MVEKTNNWLQIHQEFCDAISSSFAHQQAKQAKQILSETESGIIRILLPLMGFEALLDKGKLTKADKTAAYDFMATLPAKKLIVAHKRFAEHLPHTQLSHHSRNTYGARVHRWFDWIQAHGYWPGRYMTAEVAAQCSPFTRYGHGPVKELRTTKRRGKRTEYALKPEELPPQAKAWYDTATTFLSRLHQPGRTFDMLDAATVEIYQRTWLQIWGWQTRYNGVPLADLEPKHIFPVIDQEAFEQLSESEQTRLWRRKIRELEEILCGHHNFLIQEAKGRSPYTWVTKLCGIHTAARILYADWVDVAADYSQLPLFKRLNTEFEKNREQLKAWQWSPEVAGLTEKWPDVPPGSTALEVFQQGVLEPMRLECLPRCSRGMKKTPRRIAHRYQQFVRVALMGWMPPLRQEVDRSLKIALSCPVERPEYVPPEGHY